MMLDTCHKGVGLTVVVVGLFGPGKEVLAKVGEL